MNMSIRVCSIPKHSTLFEIEPAFLYQEVHTAYQSEMLGENKKQ